MCGIAGIVRFERGGSLREDLGRMAKTLSHRGPDAEGYWEDAAGVPAAGLVHRRLSIIDLRSVADQPLANEDGSVQVLLNGEIYNFKELRSRLAGRHVFRSEGDTEAIVHGYEEKGEGVVADLDGMFALAIWDNARRRLVLARDPFGKKPLYYWADQRRLVFGSEIKALLAAGVPAEFDSDNLGEYLAFGYVPTPRTLFRGIRQVPPASTLIVDSAGVHEPRPYWDLRFPPEGEAPPVSENEARERVRGLLTEAVQKRLVADVPLGLLLSGGLDSSAVAALMARLAPGRLKTFTVGFEGDAFFDERPHAERVARHLGAEHHVSVVRPDAAALVGTLLEHYDEPFGDSSALPTYLVSREARKHVTVVLNGDGGDETFAGYDRFYAALLADRIPAPLRLGLRQAARLLPESASRYGPVGRVRRFAEKAWLPLEARVFSWTGFLDLPSLRALLGPAFDQRRLLSSVHDAFRAANGSSLLSRLLYFNVKAYLLDDLLPKMDRMTMAHGLEARSPLLDRRLVEYVASLPDPLKRRGGAGKVILKKAVEDLLPPEILKRAKHGFGLPIRDWFRGELRPLVEDTLLDRPRLAGRLQLPALRQLFDEHVSGRADRGLQLWLLLTLELWLRKHRFE